MSYQVLARKWRPQRFDDVVGQRGVTQTLRNAIASGRIAQSFVFAGPRGVGKTTTARILARALNCEGGPTPDPCGACDPCREIAEGRDIDVLEIDAATHTQVDNVREVIISGLAISPVRNRYKIFLIDEVHQLSAHSFNALLKSIEEPPPHVVFMMATTDPGKIPDTILSRSQVFELRTIGLRAILDQLRAIAQAEGIAADEDALALIARSAEGSMRDAQSALDQVIAFAGRTVTADAVSTVLGLVGRDLLLEIAEAVADENAPALFDLAGRAVESGYDLRLVCRELARVARDLLLITVDPPRIEDPEIAAEGDRERLRGLAARFSGEDLMRSFDVLARAEADIRAATQPRYHLEMALLRWLHLRKLLPLEEVIAGLQPGGPGTPARPPAGSSGRPPVSSRPASRPGTAPPDRAAPRGAVPPRPAAPAREAALPPPSAPTSSGEQAAAPAPAAAEPAPTGAAGFRDALLAEIKRARKLLYNTVVAQARTIQVEDDRLTFTFAAGDRWMKAQLEQNREWLEGVASQIAGRPMTVAAAQGAAAAPDAEAAPAENGREAALRARALENAGVQAVLDVFSAEIREVEEID